MEIIYLLQSGLGLIAVLGILVFLLILPSNSKKTEAKIKQKKEPPKEKLPYDLKELISIVKDKETDSQKLKETLDLILKYHGTIPPKLGIRTNPEFVIYEDIIYTICRHPNTTADIVLSFNSGLEKKNEQYKAQINDALTKGLNSRVIR